MIGNIVYCTLSFFVVFSLLLRQSYFLWNIIYHLLPCPFGIIIEIKFIFYFPFISSSVIPHDKFSFKKRDKDIGATNISKRFPYNIYTDTVNSGTQK